MMERAAQAHAVFAGRETWREQGDTNGTMPDWNRLISVNEDAVGWLRLKAMGIDTPIVQQRTGTEDDWYLTHDIWGSPNPTGCPYMDPASSIDGGHLLIYGHNGGAGGRAFSPIVSSGVAHSPTPTCVAELHTPDGRVRTFLPLMSLNVPATYEKILSFPPSGSPEVKELIRSLGKDAENKTRDFDRASETATEILSLVTCSQSAFATDRRTIMLFYIADAP